MAARGGARSKSAVALPGGRLALAKFPKPDDTPDIAAGEALPLTLAARAGIRVVEHQQVRVGQHGVIVLTRFDRADQTRIPFVSGASLLALPQGDPGAYTLMADAIRQFGHDVAGDLQELWRRLVFSILASNFDDHLRNHGFLMVEAGRWALSPAYDLNPVPQIDRARTAKTPASEDREEPSVAGALEVAARVGLKSATLDAYASAFDHDLMDEARRLLNE